MPLTPAQRTLRARLGAHTLHATHDPRETTAAARRAFLGGFDRQVDPDGVLSEQERTRRAHHARKAHFTQLALRSTRARASRHPRLGHAVADDL